MSNIVPYTEDFSHWTTSSNATVTVDTHAAPSTANVGAWMADTLGDASAVSQGAVLSVSQTISSDGSSWTASLYIRKESSRTSGFPECYLVFSGGTSIQAGIAFNPQTGLTGFPSGGFSDASGVVDVDTNWWRLWWRKANNNSGNVSTRLQIYPALENTFGSGPDSSATGTLVVWGANLTNTSSVQDYEPHPAYPVSTTPPMILICHA